ncbi:MAG: hypothetical protein ACREHV_01165, partial [Rhizomicrobium sp.]
VAAILATSAAFAQPAPQGSYDQGPGAAPYRQAPGQTSSSRHHHGVMGLIKEEVRAGRLNQKEGMLLEHKIKQLHAEKRAEREARYGREDAPAQMQQPH